MKEAVEIIKNNIRRAMMDKYPDYAHDVAVYNDLLRQFNASEALDIEYNGKDAHILNKIF